ncbi:MAG: ectonucleotide pyrophosphatase/phosphodiesterase [Pseudomonadota bacterium]|nr:ectonucleotide pyrophosphatase/phosphodiesterase [Pseudomonadota bacterium]
MNTSLTRLLPVLAAVILAACASTPQHTPRPTPLLLISIDGLRPGDVNAAEMPNLARFAATGVQAEGMRPAYPTLTFPNHYTLVTGLRPDRHGIVHNWIVDHDLGSFHHSKPAAVEQSQWWGGTPIWVSARRAGLRSATLYWPGSEAEINGLRPDIWMKYDDGTSAAWRANTVGNWLLLPKSKRPDFATLYFNKVDSLSHRYGPNSPEASAARRDTDAALGALFERLRQHGKLERINIVLVSDHGFAEVPPQNLIAIESMVDATIASAQSDGQVIGFVPKPGFEQQAAQRLFGRHDHYQCWDKANLPARWHYGSNPRIPAIICQMDEGWDAHPQATVDRLKQVPLRGSHGYDPALPSMRATFIAHGPAFKPGSRLPLFDNVDVYPLMMELIGVEAAPNDGTARTFDAVRKRD